MVLFFVLTVYTKITKVCPLYYWEQSEAKVMSQSEAYSSDSSICPERRFLNQAKAGILKGLCKAYILS
jgi:hypothetical protein